MREIERVKERESDSNLNPSNPKLRDRESEEMY